MGLPKEIAEIVERFERNLDAYKSGQYNEMQFRQLEESFLKEGGFTERLYNKPERPGERNS